MPITIKSTGMKYKNPDTGVYQGVDMLEEATIRDVIVDVYSPTLPYAVGEYCLYNGELYCCTTAIPDGGEAWNLAHWDNTKVTDELENIKGAVDSIGSDDVANESNVSGTTVSDALDTLDGAITSETTARQKNGATNLLPYPYYRGSSYVEHGITYTANSDGSVTINGTADNPSAYILSLKDFGSVSFNSKNVSTGSYKAILFNASDALSLTYYQSSKNTLIEVPTGTTLNSVTVYPMICLVEDVVSGYQKYAMTSNELTDALTQDNLSTKLFFTNSARRLANANDAPYGQSSYDPNTTNIPSGGSSYGIIQCYYAMGWFIQIAYDTYGNVYKRSNINNNGWQAWKKMIDEDQVIPVAKGGTGAISAWAAKTNLGAPINVGEFVVTTSGTKLSLPNGAAWFLLIEGGFYQVTCANAGNVLWMPIAPSSLPDAQLTVDTSVNQKLTLTAPTYALRAYWFNFVDKSFTVT